MATYQLSCGQGHRFDVIQSFTAPLPACTRCGGPTEKVPSRRLPPTISRTPTTRTPGASHQHPRAP